ncbi:hypothetical protein [Bartonella sp. CL100XZDX]|uniref:hypothetical protein n=1 Tax=Bartonella sp. CL100XZDX TaxID=3243515 RepID=UPI0035CFC713
MIRAIFYYESDTQYKTYKGKAFYGMGRIFSLLVGAFEGVFILPSVKGILANLACADKGKLEVDADIIPCEMVFIASK